MTMLNKEKRQLQEAENNEICFIENCDLNI